MGEVVSSLLLFNGILLNAVDVLIDVPCQELYENLAAQNPDVGAFVYVCLRILDVQRSVAKI